MLPSFTSKQGRGHISHGNAQHSRRQRFLINGFPIWVMHLCCSYGVWLLLSFLWTKCITQGMAIPITTVKSHKSRWCTRAPSILNLVAFPRMRFATMASWAMCTDALHHMRIWFPHLQDKTTCFGCLTPVRRFELICQATTSLSMRADICLGPASRRETTQLWKHFW